MIEFLYIVFKDFICGYLLDKSFLGAVVGGALGGIFTLGGVWLTINRQTKQMKKERGITYKKEEFLQLKKSYEELISSLLEINVLLNGYFLELFLIGWGSDKNIKEYDKIIKCDAKILMLLSLYFDCLKKSYGLYIKPLHDTIEKIADLDIKIKDDEEIKGYINNLPKEFKKLYNLVLDDYKEKEKELYDLLKK